MQRKWLIGCSLGCGALILLGVVVFFSGLFWLRGSFRGVLDAAESHKKVVARYGEVEEFVPPPDGAIPPERMERFLAVRDALREPQAEMDAMFADFPPDELLGAEESLSKVLRAIGSVTSMISPIGEYVDRRNRLLLEHGMGLGEYVYIYATSYYSWLGHSPGDGPVITKETDDKGRRIMDDEDSSFGPREVTRRYRRYMLAILRNQLEAVPPGEDWRSTLHAEIGRFEARPGRVPWQDGLPPALQTSLEPYRGRLQTTYHSATNCFEIPPRQEEDWGQWSN